MKKIMLILILGLSAGLVLNDKLPNLYVYKPLETTTQPQIIEEKPPIDAEVLAQIAIEFAEHDKWVIIEAINICKLESGCTWNRVSKPNTNGTIDWGIFQINDCHTKRYGDKFKTDWKENIRVAHLIYDSHRGWSAWVAAKALGLAH